ncbi:uncharacterized protein METZ01_LOCUS437082, partial [marine metagenome]
MESIDNPVTKFSLAGKSSPAAGSSRSSNP